MRRNGRLFKSYEYSSLDAGNEQNANIQIENQNGVICSQYYSRDIEYDELGRFSNLWCEVVIDRFSDSSNKPSRVFINHTLEMQFKSPMTLSTRQKQKKMTVYTLYLWYVFRHTLTVRCDPRLCGHTQRRYRFKSCDLKSQIAPREGIPSRWPGWPSELWRCRGSISRGHDPIGIELEWMVIIEGLLMEVVSIVINTHWTCSIQWWKTSSNSDLW
jgi:hypothetical protein